LLGIEETQNILSEIAVLQAENLKSLTNKPKHSICFFAKVAEDNSGRCLQCIIIRKYSVPKIAVASAKKEDLL
jgi:hypothetical protein